ncbi:glycosyltransferase [Algoriphagus sp. NG3]|uniref:glycosyltransferase n=1 Tax=Algoriphagus sp. NG3 TaxID=3097546 RepID=UPI002A7F3B77|nr:glycosyltransferase [Algoriphagus sp. NG3]WPR77397.1 glycosyltransferase [Algoriphagus sp. NG3]
MKIIRIVSELDFGGVEQVLANSAPILAKTENIELIILVIGKGGEISDRLLGLGISVQILGKNARIPNIYLLLEISKLLFKLKPDVVHTQGAEANFHGIMGARLAGVPLIIGEEIGIPNHHSYWKAVFRYVYKQAHRVVAISEAVKDKIVALKEVEAEKVRVVYNPVCSNPVGVSKEAGMYKKDFVFITTCRLVPIKNLDRLMEALAQTLKQNPDRSLVLKIIGEGPERMKLETLSQRLGINECVQFLGYQSDVWLFLQEADAFILPSLHEGSSVSLAEAMTCGLPSIVTQVGGAVEILGASQSGLLIDPLYPISIQSAMQQMIDLSPAERLAMGARAREESKRFSVENYIQSLMSIYTFSDFMPKPSDF